MNVDAQQVMEAFLRKKESNEFMMYTNDAGRAYANYLAALKSEYFEKGVQFTIDHIKENYQ